MIESIIVKVNDENFYFPQELTGPFIDDLRFINYNKLADFIQFDDGRCRICSELAGNDRKHRCWDNETNYEMVLCYNCLGRAIVPGPGEYSAEKCRYCEHGYRRRLKSSLQELKK